MVFSLILQINRSSKKKKRITRIFNQYRGDTSIANMPLEFWKNPFQTHFKLDDINKNKFTFLGACVGEFHWDFLG
jgi:hypothetical protein